MKKYVIDANFCLRFLLSDLKDQYKIAVQKINDAKTGSIELIIYPETILEVYYVLTKVYKLVRAESVEILLSFCKSDYINSVDRSIIVEALNIHKEVNIDLVDCLLYVRSKYTNSEVLSFDQDFKKLKQNF